MGIPLQDGAVHKCPRVSLIRIAADIFLIRFICRRELPFQSCRKSCAASSSQAAVQKDLNHILRLFLRQDDTQSLISPGTYVFFDVFRVDDAAVAERHPVLLFIEIRLIEGDDLVSLCGLIIEETADDSSLEQMFGYDLRNVILPDHRVKRSLRIDDHNGTQSTQSETSCLHNADFLSEAVRRDLFFQPVYDPLAARGGTSGTAADKYV